MQTALSQTTLESSLLVDRFRPLPHVVWTTHADAAVLLDADRGLYYTLNSVAARIWELLAAGEPLAASLQSLEDEYEIERQALEQAWDPVAEPSRAGTLLK